jgi:Na+-transporting NADH:ubiquinone oxidoreductase subunit NqrB
MLSGVIGALAIGDFYLFPIIYANTSILSFNYGWICFWDCFYGNRSGYRSPTNKGKWIYGFLIGAKAVLIRVLNPA